MKLTSGVFFIFLTIVFLLLLTQDAGKYLLLLDRVSDETNRFKLFSLENLSKTEVKLECVVSNLNNLKNKNKTFKVFIVPHSHNDPGWLHTFEHYYEHKTKNVLRNVVENLSRDHRLKFIWAEISFLSLFWNEIDVIMRRNLTRLINNGQLELVTGGWVMNDEANTHYFSILQQMIEGHQWMTEHFNCLPKNSWAIDPFGHSATMPYLLKRMGIQNLVIQRIHYSMKWKFTLSRNLEFFWRQVWDTSRTTDLFTHIMPFKGYDITHTCGPNSNICYQFDFQNKFHKKDPPDLSNETVRAKAELLLRQYKKKAELFGTNILLVPIGNDFRYATEEECQRQFGNYQKLIDYMNTENTMDVEAQFATLEDYFQALHKSYSQDLFEVATVDFFTYADAPGSYWSGYFTTRPFLKKKGQVLSSFLRATEIIYGLAWSYRTNEKGDSWFSRTNSDIYKELSRARRSISLFQHHDAITGTARNHVIKDYYFKMEEAFQNLKQVFQYSALFLLSRKYGDPYLTNDDDKYIYIDENQSYCDCVGKKITLTFDNGVNPYRVIILNSLTWKRHEIVSLCTNTHFIRITTNEYIPIMTQISPVFASTGGMIHTLYCISFVADVKPLSLITYLVHSVAYRKKSQSSSLSKVTILNCHGNARVSDGFEHTHTSKLSHGFSISNHKLKAEFSNKGFLHHLSFKDHTQIPVQIYFVLYKAHKDSGAYIFRPEGYAHPLFYDPDTIIRIIEGPLYSQVEVAMTLVEHSVRIYKISGIDSLTLEVKNIIDISRMQNCELAMRITSKIKNNEVFYTDSNGFQMIKRKYTKSQPLEGNYYPMTSAVYIEDKAHRLTLVSAQPGGVSSLVEGQVEIMQDRRLSQDDHKGLGEGVLDNVPTHALYRILLEKKKIGFRRTRCSPSILSPYGYQLSHTILYPLIKMAVLKYQGMNLKWNFSPATDKLSHDLHLVKLHPLASSLGMKTGVIFHRFPVNPCFPVTKKNFYSSHGVFNLTSVFGKQLFKKIIPTSLSFLHLGKVISKDEIQQIHPMEMKAYILLP